MIPTALRAFLLLIPFATSLAVGQSPHGLRNHFRIVTSMNTIPSQELRLDSGWVAAGPLVTPGSITTSIPQGCYSQGSCTATSDYGALRCAGTGQANNCSAGGVFLWLDEWIGASPKASYSDTVAVVSPTLPNGTPVQVRFTVALQGHATMSDLSPLVQYSADVQLDGQSLRVSGAPGTASGIVTIAVGSSAQFTGRLFATLLAYGILSATPATASYDLDLRATMGLEALTPGASLVTSSGTVYGTYRSRVLDVGGGCGAGSPQLVASAPTLGTTVSLGLTGAPANASVIAGLVIGDPVASALGPCTLQLQPNAIFAMFAGVTDLSGSLSATLLALPQWPQLVGLHLTVQDFVLQTGGPVLGVATLSNALLLEIGL